MPNPLDLPGPQFLVFYAVLAAVVLVLVHVARARGENGSAPRIDASDPYLVAFLRGGKNEALRVATVSLIDRGVLAVDDATGTIVARDRRASLRRPIEQALLAHFEDGHAAATIFGHPTLIAVCADYEHQLTTRGLLPGQNERRRRRGLLLAALAILVGLAVLKIGVAIARGRSNVGFLIVLAIVSAVIAYGVTMPRRTARGSAVLADLRHLFARLRARAGSISPGGATADAALLAAVFGVPALPPAFAYARQLFPRSSGASSSSSCGSSCGSGSGCGGGGGGGCGGCGGGD